MGIFNRNNTSGKGKGGEKFRGRDSRERGFGDRGGGGGFKGREGRPEMHKAICSGCGKDCEVPFRPTGDKPVYCNDCFRNKGKDEPRRSSFGDKRMFTAVCYKCGKDCEVPFRPTGDKPVYCSQCFGKGDNAKVKNFEQPNKQLEIINAKLDKILKVLIPVTPEEAPQKIEISKPKKADKTGAKTKVAPKKIKAQKKK